MAPNTYSGITADGGTIFARYRFGHLSVRIQPPGVDDGMDGASGKSILELEHGDQYAAYIEYSELRWVTRHLVEWPEACL